MKRAIVTGGAGFIGKHLVNRLVDEGYAVTVLDTLRTGDKGELNPKAQFIQGDVSNPEHYKLLPVDNVHVVFHLAAQSSGEISFENPFNDLTTNVGGTLLLLEWCKKHGVRRFLFSSSMAVYGKAGDGPIAEDSPLKPESYYGVAKLAAEHYIRLYSAFGIQSTIFRLFSVYGPMQNINNLKQGMTSIYLAYFLKGEPILVKGSLDRYRDQTYITDVVDAFMCCLGNDVSIGKTYNIATGRKCTVRSLISTLLKVGGKSIESYPITIGEGTPGDVFGCYADVSRARSDLGWQCQHDTESGLTEMYNYFVGRRTHV